MKYYYNKYSFFILLLFSNFIFANPLINFSDLLPKKIGDWTAIDSVSQYCGEELFQLIDGGADVFLEYGFNRVITSKYKNANDELISVEVYEMKSDSAAYGIFSFKSLDTGRNINFANETVAGNNFLIFWKGKYLVSVSGYNTNKESQNDLLNIAKSIEGKIDNTGRKPEIANLFLQKGLIHSNIIYIKGNLGLYNNYSFDSENIFGVTEGVIGKYKKQRDFILRYKSNDESIKWFSNASEALKRNPKFRLIYDNRNSLLLSDQKNNLIKVDLYNDFILIVIGKHKAETEELIQKLKNKLKSLDERKAAY